MLQEESRVEVMSFLRALARTQAQKVPYRIWPLFYKGNNRYAMYITCVCVPMCVHVCACVCVFGYMCACMYVCVSVLRRTTNRIQCQDRNKTCEIVTRESKRKKKLTSWSRVTITENIGTCTSDDEFTFTLQVCSFSSFFSLGRTGSHNNM